MASSGVINGTDFRLYVAGEAVGYATSSTLTITRELREQIHKDSPSSGWRSVSVGQKSATCTVDAFYNEDAATAFASASKDPDDLATYLTSGTRVYCAFKGASGDDRYTFWGYITSWESTHPVEEDSTYSITIEVDGAITIGTVT